MVAQLVRNLTVMRRPGFDPWVGKCGRYLSGTWKWQTQRTTLGQSLQGLTSLFQQSSLFIGARNKELRAYGQQSTYKAKI